MKKLTAEGRMQLSGLAQVDLAKSDGRWEAAYSGGATMELPKEFYAQLDQHQEAKDFYDLLSRANKYAIGYRIETAVGIEKKKQVIDKIITMLVNKKTFH